MRKTRRKWRRAGRNTKTDTGNTWTARRSSPTPHRQLRNGEAEYADGKAQLDGFVESYLLTRSSLSGYGSSDALGSALMRGDSNAYSAVNSALGEIGLEIQELQEAVSQLDRLGGGAVPALPGSLPGTGSGDRAGGTGGRAAGTVGKSGSFSGRTGCPDGTAGAGAGGPVPGPGIFKGPPGRPGRRGSGPCYHR